MVELEYKAYWTIKKLNFDIKPAAKRHLIQLNELDEICHDAYHDRKIIPKLINANDKVLLYNSRAKLFSGKLRSCWSGPFRVKEVKPYGIIILWGKDGSYFPVNGQRVKPYLANTRETVEEEISLVNLTIA